MNAKQLILMVALVFFKNVYAIELIVDSQGEGGFYLVSDALKHIDDHRLTTPAPTQSPPNGVSASTYTASTVVLLSENISNYSSFDEFSDGLLVKFAGDDYWYSAKYFSTKALHLSENAHKDLNGVAWEFAVKTPYEVYVRNGVYPDSSAKPIAPFVTVRGESQRGVIVQTDGGPGFHFGALCKEATLENFSIIPQGPDKGGAIGLSPNPDNSPYVDWTMRKMHIDVSRTPDPDTIRFFKENVNRLTIEDSHIEGNFHVLNLWGTTGAVIRNNTIVGHVSSNTQSVIGLYMMPSQR